MHCPLCSLHQPPDTSLPVYLLLRTAIETGLLPVSLPSLLKHLASHPDSYPPHHVRDGRGRKRVLLLSEVHRLQRELIETTAPSSPSPLPQRP